VEFDVTDQLPTTDHIFCIRQILEKSEEYSETVQQLFVDLKKESPWN
jgi:hypothetical protein